MYPLNHNFSDWQNACFPDISVCIILKMQSESSIIKCDSQIIILVTGKCLHSRYYLKIGLYSICRLTIIFSLLGLQITKGCCFAERWDMWTFTQVEFVSHSVLYGLHIWNHQPIRILSEHMPNYFYLPSCFVLLYIQHVWILYLY